MQDFTVEYIAKASIKGVFALVSRTFLVQLLSIFASFILTIYLDPSIFGVFFVVSSIVVFLNYFQDIGLAASLIQKKEEPTVSELRTTFTVQLSLVLLLVIPALIFSKNIATFYKLDDNGYFLFIALVISFFLSSLRTIPTVLMERHLNYQKLVIPQISENLIYNICLIFFSISGFGITTFTIAVLARSVTGLLFTYLIQSWSIGFNFDLNAFKKLVSFGIPFQANSILALIKDDLLTIYLGKILPYSQLGYVGFAQKWAFMPIRLIMDNAIKITFPSYSRLQNNTQALKLAVEKSLFFVSIFMFPAAIGMMLYSPFFIQYFPRYSKWEPALISLVFFSLNSIFSSISTPLTNFLNAIGKVKITLFFMIFWTVTTWISTLLLVTMYGYNGVAAASFIVSISSIAVVFVSRRYVKFSIVRPIVRQFFAAFIMGIFIILTRSFVSNLASLFLFVIFSGGIYFLVLYFLAKDDIREAIVYIIRTIRSKK